MQQYVARTLSDFKSVDNSLVFPRGAAPEVDNITEVAPGTFNFLLRHRGNPWSPLNPEGTRGAWYDGDRDLDWNEGRRDGRYHDKSRAEVTDLHGVGRKIDALRLGTTWDIVTTVRLDPAFVPSVGYCNIMQPVFDQSFLTLTGLVGNEVTANLNVFTDGIGSRIRTVRAFPIRRGRWTQVTVRVRFGRDGSYQCSVDGDPFVGIKLDTTRGRTPFNAKWGLYCTATTDVLGRPMGDSVVQHRSIALRQVA